jgi:hypothetical protein
VMVVVMVPVCESAEHQGKEFSRGVKRAVGSSQ